MHALLFTSLVCLAASATGEPLDDFAWSDRFADVSAWSPRPE